MWLGIALALVSCGGGVWMGVVWCDATVTASKATHKREMDEVMAEVKRARAQVAGLVGK
jgi:hypothetical protein